MFVRTGERLVVGKVQAAESTSQKTKTTTKTNKKQQITSDAGGERVEHDARAEHGAAVVRIKGADERQPKHAHRDHQDLRADAQARGKQVDVRREAKDGAMEVLPPRLIRLLPQLGVVARVLDEVVLEHAQQDGGEEAGQK